MRFLNPKTDFAFKKIFGSDDSQDILISLLNAILELHSPNLITEVTILDPCLSPKVKGMKESYLDLQVKDQRDRKYIVEMQVLNIDGFEKRVLYNACKAYVNQISEGDDYPLLRNVIAVSFTDFVMFKELSGPVNLFRLRSEGDSIIYSDDLELIFAELP